MSCYIVAGVFVVVSCPAKCGVFAVVSCLATSSESVRCGVMSVPNVWSVHCGVMSVPN